MLLGGFALEMQPPKRSVNPNIRAAIGQLDVHQYGLCSLGRTYFICTVCPLSREHAASRLVPGKAENELCWLVSLYYLDAVAKSWCIVRNGEPAPRLAARYQRLRL